MSVVLRGFPPSTYRRTPLAKTLVRPCSSKKFLIYELETTYSILLDGYQRGHIGVFLVAVMFFFLIKMDFES